LAGLTLSAQASRIAELSRRYGAGRWRYDRQSEAIPETYLGTINEWLWRAFKSGAPMSLGIRQLRSILGATPAQAVGFPHGNSPAFEIPAAGGTVVVSPPRWLPKIRGDLVTRADARRRRFRCKRPR